MAFKIVMNMLVVDEIAVRHRCRLYFNFLHDGVAVVVRADPAFVVIAQHVTQTLEFRTDVAHQASHLHESRNLVRCFFAGSILELLPSAIPLPGGTLGAEGGFAFLFGSMFGSALSAGYVVWRMVEYVLPVLVSVPLMGLRTRSGLSINARLRRIRARWRR